MSADPAVADRIWLAWSALLLLAAGAVALRHRSRPLNEGGMAVPALFCLWSLLVTYHNGNNLMLMLPAFAFLWFHGDRRTAARHWLPIVGLQAALMFDVPVRLAGAAGAPGWNRIAIEHFDRLVVLAAFAYVSAVWWRQPGRHTGGAGLPGGAPRFVQRDRGDHREQHAVGRRAQAGIPDALHRDGDMPDDRAERAPRRSACGRAAGARRSARSPVAQRDRRRHATAAGRLRRASWRYSSCAWLKKNSRDACW